MASSYKSNCKPQSQLPQTTVKILLALSLSLPTKKENRATIHEYTPTHIVHTYERDSLLVWRLATSHVPSFVNSSSLALYPPIVQSNDARKSSEHNTMLHAARRLPACSFHPKSGSQCTPRALVWNAENEESTALGHLPSTSGCTKS